MELECSLLCSSQRFTAEIAAYLEPWTCFRLRLIRRDAKWWLQVRDWKFLAPVLCNGSFSKCCSSGSAALVELFMRSAHSQPADVDVTEILCQAMEAGQKDVIRVLVRRHPTIMRGRLLWMGTMSIRVVDPPFKSGRVGLVQHVCKEHLHDITFLEVFLQELLSHGFWHTKYSYPLLEYAQQLHLESAEIQENCCRLWATVVRGSPAPIGLISKAAAAHPEHVGIQAAAETAQENWWTMCEKFYESLEGLGFYVDSSGNLREVSHCPFEITGGDSRWVPACTRACCTHRGGKIHRSYRP